MFLYGLVWGHNPIFVDFGLSCHKALSNLYYKNRSGGERMVVFISPNEGYLQENPKVRLHFSDVPIPDIQKRILGM